MPQNSASAAAGPAPLTLRAHGDRMKATVGSGQARRRALTRML
ncbi:hypothetical protein [Arthrobacter oryzae]|nr:hypothetical protein [Arthrobacter oryzae]